MSATTGKGGEGATLREAEERAGQILEHLYLGSQSERLLMSCELGILMCKRERHAARKALKRARALVLAQAEDKALWLLNPTAPEAYILQALRDLHACIERTDS